MDFAFRDKNLRRLYSEEDFNAGFAEAIVTAFRKRMQQIRSARNQRDLRALKSLRFEKLKGKRKHQYSLRLNDQWRLIFEIKKKDGEEQLIIVAIEDYHGKKK